ncbi:TetR/AcrR family transcriptional regulator [Nocardioides taihuensis]|uniref:TetR/AcrR family transcriptional regulator n=1 Tax=Nocardioides taihuensis TaxID=1835606 RepID=A0ABW0BS80_9ACTN
MPAGRKRKSPEVRRREILDAVIAIGSDSGLDAVSVRDVAERCGVAPGLIHHYFPSMDELLAESFGSWADSSLRQLQEISAGASPRVALALTVANLSPDQRIWHDALSTASRYSQLRARARSLSEDYLAHVEGLVRAGVEVGQFACPDPRESAWRIILVLDGMVAMMHILDLIGRDELATIVGPVVENELDLARGSFTELVQAVLASDGVAAGE